MHYEKTKGIVRIGHKMFQEVWLSRIAGHEVILVWLLGYALHLVADATIHHLVQAIVGPYEQNK